ncbi:MAG: STAS domain-containing protein [Vulcanimicrobiaceae bacterium]|jgi:anti-anti-sigma factor
MGLQRLSTSWVCENGVRELTIVGDIDISTVPEFDEQLCEVRRDDPFSLIVSLAQCTYCDSTGLSVLLRHARQTPNFIVVSPEGTDVRRLLRVAGVEKALGVVDDLSKARAAARFEGQFVKGL